MRYLVTGGTGQLGREVAALLQRDAPEHEVLSPGRDYLDLCDPAAVSERLNQAAPDVVVNCAAWTAVDDAECDASSARKVNTESPLAMASYCAKAGASLLQVSTDYVFSGSAQFGYREWDPMDPASVYGKTKAEAETLIAEALPDRYAVVRTAWLYGESRNNFPCKVLSRLKAGEDVRVVDDQTGSPTWSRDVAARIVALLRWWRLNDGPIGTVHAVNSGIASWFEFAQSLAVTGGFDPARVAPISTSSLSLAAPRPAHSQLLDLRTSENFGLPPMRGWQAALRAACPELVPFWMEG